MPNPSVQKNISGTIWSITKVNIMEFISFWRVLLQKWTSWRDWSSNSLTTMSQSSTLATAPRGFHRRHYSPLYCFMFGKYGLLSYFIQIISICLFIYVSLFRTYKSLSLSLSLSQYIHIYISLFISIYLFVYVPACSSIYLSRCVWIHVSFYICWLRGHNFIKWKLNHFKVLEIKSMYSGFKLCKYLSRSSLNPVSKTKFL